MSVKLASRLNQELNRDYRNNIINYTTQYVNNIDPTLIDLQSNIDWNIRPLLLDLIYQLVIQLQLSSKTLFRTVYIFDKYCSKRIIRRQHFQLLGLTCLWIASKIEDDKSKCICLNELVSACNKAYHASLFTTMELHILSTLQWDISGPTLDDSLDLCFLNQNYDQLSHNKTYILARFLCWKSNYDRSLMFFCNKLKSMACYLMASKILENKSCDCVIDSTYINISRDLDDIKKISILMTNQLITLNLDAVCNRISIEDQPFYALKFTEFLLAFKKNLAVNKYNPYILVDLINKELNQFVELRINVKLLQFSELFSNIASSSKLCQLIFNFTVNIDELIFVSQKPFHTNCPGDFITFYNNLHRESVLSLCSSDTSSTTTVNSFDIHTPTTSTTFSDLDETSLPSSPYKFGVYQKDTQQVSRKNSLTKPSDGNLSQDRKRMFLGDNDSCLLKKNTLNFAS